MSKVVPFIEELSATEKITIGRGSFRVVVVQVAIEDGDIPPAMIILM